MASGSNASTDFDSVRTRPSLELRFQTCASGFWKVGQNARQPSLFAPYGLMNLHRILL